MTIKERDELIVNFMPLAKSIAIKRKKTLPKHIDFEEIESVAFMGLVKAAEKFDKNISPSFSSYASLRIFGEIQDFLRNNFKNTSQIVSSLEEIDVEQIEKSFEISDDILFHLSDDDKDIIKYYYVDQLSLKEIGSILGVSESRISQKIKESKEIIKQTIAA